MSVRRRLLIAALGALVVYQGAALVLDGLTPGPGGSPSSSYATAREGLAAYADLLARTGHSVTRLRKAPASATPTPGTTLVVLDPGLLTGPDLSALRSFVDGGGTLIAGGVNPDRWLSGLMPAPPRWSPSGPREATAVTALTPSVRLVASAGQGSFQAGSGTGVVPIVAGPGGTLLELASEGRGRVLLLADASPLQNRGLAHADNAALGVALAGPAGTPVAFAEGVHGYGSARGLAALPARWKWALIGLALAAAVAVAARFRRLGDPDPEPPAAPPARRVHVEALALALQRTGQPAAAAAPVRERARELVLARTGVDPDAGAEELRRAAAALGLDPREARAVAALEIPTDDDQVMAIGNALAALERR